MIDGLAQQVRKPEYDVSSDACYFLDQRIHHFLSSVAQMLKIIILFNEYLIFIDNNPRKVLSFVDISCWQHRAIKLVIFLFNVHICDVSRTSYLYSLVKCM